MSIAAGGYELDLCGTDPRYSPGSWCGNTGWFPGYPWLMSITSRLLNISLLSSGVLISRACFLLFLLVVWIAFLEARLSTRNLLALLCIAFFPGQIFYSAVFPISAFLLCTLLFLFFIQKEKFIHAAIFGTLAPIIYTTGFLLIPVMLVWNFINPQPLSIKTRLLRTLASTAPVAFGFFLVLWLFDYTTGSWDAFFKVQHKWGHSLNNPIDTLFYRIEPLFNFTWNGLIESLHFQTLFIAIVVAFLCSMAFKDFRRRNWTPSDRLFLTYTGFFWLFPLLMGKSVSLYRAESLLVPIVFLLYRRQTAALATFLIPSLVLAISLTVLYFQSRLV